MSHIKQEQIIQAVARGWCSEKNSHKVMDSDLAFAIAAEVMQYIDSAALAQPAGHLEDIAAFIGVGGYNGATSEQLAQRIKDEFVRLGAQPEPVNEWKEAVIDELVAAKILTPENAIHPRKAVQDVISWHFQAVLKLAAAKGCAV